MKFYGSSGRVKIFEVSSPRSFRLQCMWLEHQNFIATVRRICSSPIMGRPPQVVINDMIPSLVTTTENAFLTSVPYADVIHDAIFAMDNASASRPDGFSGSQFQLHCSCSEAEGLDFD
ncbi:hypothetical protein Dsin_009083 [Dipteronia sinensis]|uniref:Uncharacterized protein n=1 Tax=Dipteronia sinensis TaxID=43782 RepID=A0AAE0APY4_9ROSI|nr:hypothetical protein Dsin_009083 [Dipteronia sinensis]